MPIRGKFKTSGMNWSNRELHGQNFTRIAGNQALIDAGVKVPGNDTFAKTGKPCGKLTDPSYPSEGRKGRRTDIGNGARFTTRDCGIEGKKQGGDWFGPGEQFSISRTTGSKSPARKAASALIAKIPLALSQHIASVYYPR